MICPNCQVEQSVSEKNFGALYTCPSCQSVYFLNFDGQPDYGEVPTDFQVGDANIAENTNVQSNAQEEPVAYANDFLNTNYDLPNEESLASSALAAVVATSAFDQIAGEISDFGNKELQIATLNYDVKISGLDNAEIKDLFLEAIEDSKFGWSASEIMASIINGEVFIKELNPVKAYILAKRLQFLDVEKKWTQHALA